MECKICFEKYDQQLRKPVSINCGHSFCKTCLSSLKVSNSYACPTCRQSITNEQPNYTVLDLLDLTLIVDVHELLSLASFNAFSCSIEISLVFVTFFN